MSVPSNLYQAFDLSFGALAKHKPLCITVVGSGGKTTTIEHLARNWACGGNSVLVATTTKMAHPSYHSYPFDRFYIVDNPDFDQGPEPLSNSVVLYGTDLPQSKKIGKVDDMKLKNVASRFDYVLIEGDGCRNRPLAYHGMHEPVIPPWTDAVIAVMGLQALGKRLDKQILYNYDMYIKDYRDDHQMVSCALYHTLMHAPQGVLKHTESFIRVLFLNQSDTTDDLQVNAMRELVVQNGGLESCPVFCGSWFTQRLDWYDVPCHTHT